MASLGRKNTEMLLAARDSLGNDIDVNGRLTEDGNEEYKHIPMAALHGECIFNRGGQITDDDLSAEDVNVGLADDPLALVEK